MHLCPTLPLLRYRGCSASLRAVGRRWQHAATQAREHAALDGALLQADSHSTDSSHASPLQPPATVRHRPLRVGLRNWQKYYIPEVEARDRTRQLPIVGGRKALLDLVDTPWQSEELKQARRSSEQPAAAEHNTSAEVKAQIKQLRELQRQRQHAKVIQHWHTLNQAITTPTAFSQLPLAYIPYTELAILSCCQSGKAQDLQLVNDILSRMEGYYNTKVLTSHHLVRIYCNTIRGFVQHLHRPRTALKLVERINTKFNLYSKWLYMPLLQHTTQQHDLPLLLQLIQRLVSDKHLLNSQQIDTQLMNLCIQYVLQVEGTKGEALSAETVSSSADVPQTDDEQTTSTSLTSSAALQQVLDAFTAAHVQPNGGTIIQLLSTASCHITAHLDAVIKYMRQQPEASKHRLLYNTTVAQAVVSTALRLGNYHRAISYLQAIQPTAAFHPLRTTPMQKTVHRVAELDAAETEAERKLIGQQVRAELHSQRPRVDDTHPIIGAEPYNLIIGKSAKQGKLSACLWICSLLQVRWMSPSARAYAAMVRAAGRENSAELYWELYQSWLTASARAHPPSMWCALIDGAVQLQDSAHRNKLVQLMLQHATGNKASNKPTESVWNRLISHLSQQQRFDDVFALFDSMQQHELTVSSDTLMHAIKQVNDNKHVAQCTRQVLLTLAQQQITISPMLVTALHDMRDRCNRNAGIATNIDDDFHHNGYAAYKREFAVDDSISSSMSPAQVRRHVVADEVRKFNAMQSRKKTSQKAIDYCIRMLNTTDW